jgi:hypothetical protein
MGDLRSWTGMAKATRYANSTGALLFTLAMVSCRAAVGAGDVQSVYDKHTGKLVELKVNTQKDNKPNIHSYMSGASFVRIEIDSDEDGKIDRWEYYSSDQKLEKVGLSRSHDGKPDTWARQGPDGTVAAVEISTRHDGKPNRTEFYERGVLVRAEQDTDADGKVDRWETYAAGSLATVGFDTEHSGRPTRTVDYRSENPASPAR